MEGNCKPPSVHFAQVPFGHEVFFERITHHHTINNINTRKEIFLVIEVSPTDDITFSMVGNRSIKIANNAEFVIGHNKKRTA